MNVLSLREYQSLKPGDAFDAVHQTVSKRQFAWLERFSEDYENRYHAAVFRPGAHGTLVAQNYVGVIHLDDCVIEILPKIDGFDSDTDTVRIRENLLRMLLISRTLDVLPGEISGMREQDSFWDILMNLFCQRLRQAVSEGMVRHYEYQEDILPVLRGRLDMLRLIQLSPAQGHLLACCFDELTADTPINQILKTALRVVTVMAEDYELQQTARELIALFDDVTDLVPDALRWDNVVLDRLTQHYAPLLQIARMLIENAPPDVTTGEKTGFAMLFDMNRLFESYIGAVCKNSFDSDEMAVSLQGPVNHLLKKGVEQAFELRPDITLRNRTNGTYLCILDTKWKILDDEQRRDGVSQSDIYQMYAYATRYQADKVVLVYPHHPKLSAMAGVLDTYQLMDSMADQTIQVATVNLRDLSTVREQLAQIIR